MSALLEVIAPANQEGTQATILRWCKSPGEAIQKDEPLLELETDKVTVEVPSPASGVLCEILRKPNEAVSPGDVLARLRIGAEAASRRDEPRGAAAPLDAQAIEATSRAPAAAAVDGRRLLSPAVRRLIAEHGLAPGQIAGTGSSGRLTAQDIARHLAHRDEHKNGANGQLEGAVPAPASLPSSRVPHTPIRRRVAEHMAMSLALAPHVTTLFEADLTQVEAHRAAHATEFERQGVRLTLTAYFVAACARALIAHPTVNSSFHDDGLELHADANIGVGTALGNDGIIVPVVHRAQDLSLCGVARRLGELVRGARAGKLTPDLVRGGTFTISNHGVGGSLLAAPIVINQPQVAILGVGKVERRVCVVAASGAEAIAIRSMCYLTLSIDHRALDAFQANAFLGTVVQTLEHWSET